MKAQTFLITAAIALLASACGGVTDAPDTSGTPVNSNTNASSGENSNSGDPSQNTSPGIIDAENSHPHTSGLMSAWEFRLEGASEVASGGDGVGITSQAFIDRSTIILDTTMDAVAGEQASGPVRITFNVSQLTDDFSGFLAHPDPDSGSPTTGPQFIASVDVCTPGIWCTGIPSLPGSQLRIDRSTQGTEGHFDLTLQCEHVDAPGGLYEWQVRGRFESPKGLLESP